MKLKEYIRSIGSSLTVTTIARLEGYKTDTAFHNMYSRGEFEKIKEKVLDAEDRFQSACKTTR